MVKLLVTTGFISKWGEVARIIVLMLLLGEEGGGAFCPKEGGLLVRVVFLGNGLAPMLLFRMFGIDVYRFFFSCFFFVVVFAVCVCYILDSLSFNDTG